MLQTDTSTSAARDALLLSFVAGYVDTVGFVALFGLFTAHVTGNLVLLGAALIRDHGGLLAKLAALPVFIVVVAGVTGYVNSHRARARGREALRPLIAVQVLALGAFATLGRLSQPLLDPDAPLAISAGLCGVVAMSIQNAYSRLLMSDLPPTTVMTGGVTQVAIDAARWALESSPEGRVRAGASLLKFAPPVFAFAAGAITGALMFARLGFPSLMAPMLALAWVGLGLQSSAATSLETRRP